LPKGSDLIGLVVDLVKAGRLTTLDVVKLEMTGILSVEASDAILNLGHDPKPLLDAFTSMRERIASKAYESTQVSRYQSKIANFGLSYGAKKPKKQPPKRDDAEWDF